MNQTNGTISFSAVGRTETTLINDYVNTNIEGSWHVREISFLRQQRYADAMYIVAGGFNHLLMILLTEASQC